MPRLNVILIAAATATCVALLRPTPADATTAGCTAATLTGTYGYVTAGFFATAPFVGAGTLTFDGVKKLKGSRLYSDQGSPLSLEVKGHYKVDTDCSVTIAYDVYRGTSIYESSTWAGSVVYGGQKISLISESDSAGATTATLVLELVP